MGATQKLSSFNCEIKILEAKNTEFKSPKNLFVRYYLSSHNYRRNNISLNTTHISSISDFTWNQSFSLECLGSLDSIHSLEQSTVVFELRQAKTRRPVFGGSSSKILGRGEMAWREVFESPNMGIERWVSLVSSGNNNNNNNNGCHVKQPKLKVGMRVRFFEEMEMKKKKKMKMKRFKDDDDECGCCEESTKVGDFCGDYQLFALAAAMEFL